MKEKDVVEKKNSRKRWGILLLLFLVITISIGYAAMTSNLDINGSSTIKGQTWDVHFENLTNISKTGLTSDTGTGERSAVIRELSTTPSNKKDDQNIDFAISMKQPGDQYSFKVNVVNAGSLNARCKLEVTQLTSPASNYLTWSVVGISTNSTGEIINAGSSKQITVTVTFKDSVTELPSSDITANLSARISAIQA